MAKAPPHDNLRIIFATWAFHREIKVCQSTNVEAAEIYQVWSFDPDGCKEAIKRWRKLAKKWDKLWPVLYSAIVDARKRYGRVQEIPANLPIVAISPPPYFFGIPRDSWTLYFEMPDFDGFYYVDFRLNGRVVEAGAHF